MDIPLIKHRHFENYKWKYKQQFVAKEYLCKNNQTFAWKSFVSVLLSEILEK